MAPVASLALPAPRDFQPLPLGDSPHVAFPATTRLPDGRVRMIWRESSGHLASDGRVMTSVGDPAFDAWSTPTEVVLDTSGPTRDMRPGALTTIGGWVYLTYFFWENGAPAGAYVVESRDGGASFGTSSRVDGGRPYAAVSSPLVVIGNKLIVAWYGREPGESIDTSWLATSTNGGVTWSQLRIANAIHLGKAHNEPWPLARGNTLVVLYRDDNWFGMAARVSPDAGATWGPSLHIIDNATGNPASVWAPNGAIYVVFRHTGTRDAMLAVSRNAGASWQTDPVPVLRAPANLPADSVGMTYAAPVVLGDGQVWCPIGMERSLDSSSLYGGWL